MNEDIVTTIDRITAERAEEARRVTQGYEIQELRVLPDSALRRWESALKKIADYPVEDQFRKGWPLHEIIETFQVLAQEALRDA